jgi:hypothetical protein
MSMRRRFRSQFATYLGSVFTVIVLLHALITGPLLVLCMPGDGHCLVEFVGHDPCHHFKVVQADSDASTTLACEEDGDSCVDLMIDSPGVAQAGIDLVSLPAGSVVPALADPCDCAFSCPHVPEVYKQAREPVMLPTVRLLSDYSLRI